MAKAKKDAKPREIKKFQQLPPELRQQQEDADTPFMIGDMFLTERDGQLIRLREISEKEVWANNNPGDRTKKKVWWVYFDESDDWELTKWKKKYEDWSFEDFVERLKSGKISKCDKPIEQIVDEANKVINGEISMQVYMQSEMTNSLNEETALIGRNSKDSLIAIQKGLEEKKKTAELIHKAVAYEMEKRRQGLEKIKRELYGIVAVFEKQVKKIMRVITTIELYLGIEEELHQIQSGEKAPIDTTICFRQMVLYIDEEVGTHIDGGLDFKSIKEFDKWLVTGNNIDIVLPEKKGVVVMNPRRRDKDYGLPKEQWFLNVMMNVPNHRHTYILIRNGDCIYRIFTEKLTIKHRLFPLKKELQKLAKKIQEATFDREKEEVEDEMYQFKKQAMLLQGLVDRTEVFHPMPVERLNIFRLDDAGDLVRFIYDAEASLPSGRPSFWDWHKTLNGSIKHGSRILITDGAHGTYEKYSTGRIYYDCNEYNAPPAPSKGVYEVEEYKGGEQKRWLNEDDYKKAKADGLITKDVGMSRGGQHIVHMKFFYDEPHLTIMYNPKDEVGTSGWGNYDPHERKKRVRYRIYPDDKFILHYDQLSIEEVDFYLKSRVDREDYLEMMPILKEVKPHLLAEQKLEDFFAEFVFGRNQDVMLESELRKRIYESIRWWKYKNKWKRPITKDDTLALRMIEQRVLSPNYRTFKLH